MREKKQHTTKERTLAEKFCGAGGALWFAAQADMAQSEG